VFWGLERRETPLSRPERAQRLCKTPRLPAGANHGRYLSALEQEVRPNFPIPWVSWPCGPQSMGCAIGSCSGDQKNLEELGSGEHRLDLTGQVAAQSRQQAVGNAKMCNKESNKKLPLQAELEVDIIVLTAPARLSHPTGSLEPRFSAAGFSNRPVIDKAAFCFTAFCTSSRPHHHPRYKSTHLPHPFPSTPNNLSRQQNVNIQQQNLTIRLPTFSNCAPL